MTPKWTIDTYQDRTVSRGFTIRDRDGCAIATVYGTPDGEMSKHKDILVNAPQMLELLRRLVEEIQDDKEVFYCHESQTVRYGLASLFEKAQLLVEKING